LQSEVFDSDVFFISESTFPVFPDPQTFTELLERLINGPYDGNNGKFEGLHLDDENITRSILENVDRWKKDDLTYGEREFFLNQVKEMFKSLTCGLLWWNPDSKCLPANYIERKACKLSQNGNTNQKSQPVQLEKVIEQNEPFLWLVDYPGMGKSTVTTKMEETWRTSISSWRVITRVNLKYLNLTQHLLSKNSKIDLPGCQSSLEKFLHKFVPYIPIEKLKLNQKGQRIKVIILMDGLDEVSSEHEATMISLLNSLINSPKETSKRFMLSKALNQPQMDSKFRLEKLFLTTRPHLQKVIENEF